MQLPVPALLTVEQKKRIDEQRQIRNQGNIKGPISFYGLWLDFEDISKV